MVRRLAIAAGTMVVVSQAAALPTAALGLFQEAAPDLWPLVAAGLAWLIPAGLTLIAAAGVPEERAWQTALAGVAAAGIGTVAFFLTGFGLAFGGIGLARGDVAGLDGLIWEWSLLGGDWGPTWGMMGLRGWALGGPAATTAAYALFAAYLPWAATAALVPLLALRGRTPALVPLLAGLLASGVLFPLGMNWVWGGGWLANLGINLGVGHGLVDFAGAGTVFLVGGAVALAGLLALVPRKPRRAAHERDLPVPLPRSHMPLLAAAGALFILAGAMGWAWASPLLILDSMWPMRGAVTVMLAAAAGALVPMAYTWFAAGRGDPLMAAKGLAAGAIAGMALGPFVQPGAALAVGALVGLLVPLATYVVNEVLRVADDTHVTSIYLLGAMAGIIALGILADGLAGDGWNQVGVGSYLGVAGQGVTGLMPAESLQQDWPGQMQAQLVGLAALFLVPFFVASLFFVPVAVVLRGVQRPGEEEAAASPVIVVPATLVAEHAVEVGRRPDPQPTGELEAMEAERP